MLKNLKSHRINFSSPWTFLKKLSPHSTTQADPKLICSPGWLLTCGQPLTSIPGSLTFFFATTACLAPQTFNIVSVEIQARCLNTINNTISKLIWKQSKEAKYLKLNLKTDNEVERVALSAMKAEWQDQWQRARDKCITLMLPKIKFGPTGGAAMEHRQRCWCGAGGSIYQPEKSNLEWGLHLWH